MTDIMFLPVSRVLTPLEAQLFSYLGNEREAVALAKVIGSLPEDADYSVIEQAVAKALAAALESKIGATQTTYLGGRLDNHWKETQ